MTTLRNLVADLSFAVRLVRRRGGAAFLIVLTLAIGIGTATTMLDAVDTILLQPIPVDEPDRVMTLWRVSEDSNELGTVAPGTVADWLERSTVFSHIAGAEPYGLDYDDGSGPRSIGTWRVTKGFFDILRSQPRYGRLLDERDYQDGAEPALVVGYDFWNSKLGANLEVVNSTILLDGVPRSIVGVLPANFPYSEGRQFYVPRRLVGSWRQNRHADYYSAYGRIAPNVTRAQAEADLREISAATANEFPNSDAGMSAAVLPMASSLGAGVRPGLLLLLVASLLIFAVSCVNATNLILAEAARRSREMAIRAAVGAGRTRIVRQLLTESVFLAALSGALGLILSVGGLAAFRYYGPEGLPRLNELGVDFRLIGIGIGVSALVVVLVGLLPALRVLSADLHPALKPGGRGGLASPGASRLRSLLVGVQVAIAVILLAGGGLLTRSWVEVTRTEQGYSPDGVVAIEGHIWSQRSTAQERLAFVRELEEILESRAGVQATVASSMPLSTAIGNEDATVRKPTETSSTSTMAIVAGEGFFPTLGIDVLQGKGIDTTIRPDGEPVAVVSKSLADQIWPEGIAVGQILEVEYNGIIPKRRIIGVVNDVHYRSLEQSPKPVVYLPFAQVPTGSLYFVMRSPGPSADAASNLESTIRKMEPSLGLDQAIIIEEQMRQAGKARRFSAMILAAFASISALLTGIGLFGLVAHTVRSTQHELGVRLALGAWPTRLRAVILRRAARLVAIGAAIGLSLFLILSNFLRGVLYGVAPQDPMTLLTVSIVIMAIGFLAAMVPAHMATRVNPVSALRAE